MHPRSFVPSVCVLLLTASGAALAPAHAQTAASGPRKASAMTASAPLTRPERTGFRETSRYDDVVRFINDIDARSPLIHQTTFGYSLEGRPLPLVVVGKVKDASAAAVKASGKTRVYIQGNIHAGEVEGKEAMQILLRELAAGQHAAWLDSLVLLIAPIYNADGNERVQLNERPQQNGPVGGVGTRPNAQQLDLNRDHMKMESPEARSLAWLLREYDPQLGVDLHTTNGTYHAYHLTYSVPMHPNTPAPIVDWLRQAWIPSITTTIKQKDGWDFYYYGNVGERGPGASASQAESARSWATFDYRPRFNNNYFGLRNRLAILSEAYAYLSFEDRIRVTQRFVIEILNYASANAARIKTIVEDADRQPVIGESLAVRATLEKSADAVDILMGGVARVRHPYTGLVMLQRTDERRVERMPVYGTFAATEREKAPAAYFVPASLDAIVDLLHAHGARTVRLDAPRAIDVEVFEIASSTAAAQRFQNHNERTVTGRYAARRETVPAGTVMVPMDQPLARVIFTLLEPRSDDGVVNWNMLDKVLEETKTYPIWRTHDRAAR